MITEQDLRSAIAECNGQRNPDANTCIKLAAFYTLMREMYGEPDTQRSENAPANYSFAPAPDKPGTISIESDSEFARVIGGRKQEEIWPVLDELMDTLNKMQPRLYYMVMDRLQ